MIKRIGVGVLLVASVILPVVAKALVRLPQQGTNAGPVQLPYMFNSGGSQWYIYQDGMLRNQGGGRQPVYGTAAQLTIDGNQFSDNNNTATMDNGDLVLVNSNQTAVTVTRRVYTNADDPMTRIIDVYKNSTNDVKTVNMQLTSEFSWGLQQNQMIVDPKHKGNNIAWVGMSQQQKCGLEIYAGKGSKLLPSINPQPGNNSVMATMSIVVPANKEVAIMHFHGVVASMDAASKYVQDMKESEMLKHVPMPLRKEIINFPSSQSWIGDIEILRGDAFDVVELRGSDQIHGTLKETSYKLETFYGNVELPVERVIGLINIGQFRPRQLVVTEDGEIFSGRMAQSTIAIALTNGQTVQVPLEQINRVGYRKRDKEPEEWVFDKPMVMMRSGDRVQVEMPVTPVEVMTRYGVLSLAPSSMAAVVFQSEDNGVHNVFLTDGSKFAGIVSTAAFDYRLSGSGPSQMVHFATDSIMRMQLAVTVADADRTTPAMNLTNQDLLVGTVTGKQKLDTTFDTIDIDGPQIRKIDRPAESTGNDVQITLWDGTVISGLLEESNLPVHLLSGPDVSVPVAMIMNYDQPLPQPSPAMTKQVEAAVAQLNDNDFAQRDSAEATLTAMGPPVMGLLKGLRGKQGPEAQGRIDNILKKLDAAMTPKAVTHGGPVNSMMIEQFDR